MGGQLNTQQAALLGSQETGLPLALVQALIIEEGTINNGHNNPFDVTQAFASYTAYPAIPGGGWGSQSGGNPYNPSGIASFPDIQTGVLAWADGIKNQPIYAQLRNAIQYTGNDIPTLVANFPSGYAGGSPTWANNVISIAQGLISQGVSGQGQMPASPIQQASTGTTTGAPPSPASLAATATGPGGVFSGPAQAISSAGSDTLSAINNVGQQIANAANNLGSGVSQFQAFIAWLDQPNLGTRIALAVVGFFILLLGLILFGVSFLPKGTKLPVPVPV